jgi:hypothetical protein
VYYNQYGSNLATNATLTRNAISIAQGSPIATGAQILTNCVTSCKKIIYMSPTLIQPDKSSGSDADLPWNYGYSSNGKGGTCTSGQNPIGLNTSFPETAFRHAAGTSATNQYRIASERSNTYIFFANMADTYLLNYAANAVADCTNGRVAGLSFDDYDGFFMDNATISLTNGGDNFQDAAYSTAKNIGSCSASCGPYASAWGTSNSCGGNGWGAAFFNGTFCSQTAQLTQGQLTTLEVTTDAQLLAQYTGFEAAMKHYSGTQFDFYDNGACFNTNLTLMDYVDTKGCFMEKQVVDTCIPQTGGANPEKDYPVDGVIDVLTAIAADATAAAKKTIIFDTDVSDATCTGSPYPKGPDPLGSANHQSHLRLVQTVEGVGWYPNISDQSWMEYVGSTPSTCGTGAQLCNTVNVWPFDYLVLQSPYYTPVAAGPYGCGNFADTGHCTTGGVNDPGIILQGTAPNSVLYREFAHAWYDPSFDNLTGNAFDTGPILEIVNLSGVAQTIPIATINAATHNAFTHIMNQCHPTAGFTNANPISSNLTCSGTSGGDVGSSTDITGGTGPGAMDCSWVLPTSGSITLADLDGLVLTTKTSSDCRT